MAVLDRAGDGDRHRDDTTGMPGRNRLDRVGDQATVRATGRGASHRDDPWQAIDPGNGAPPVLVRLRR